MTHPGINYLDLSLEEKIDDDAYEKTHYYHLFTKQFRNQKFIIRNALKIFRKIFLIGQKVLHIKRKFDNLHVKKGCNWCSITPELAEFYVNQREYIHKLFKNTWACDEIYKQTLAWNNEKIRKTISILNPGSYPVGNNSIILALREIDWSRGKPYVWKSTDFDYLMQSNALFARKFSTSVDLDIIKMLIANL